MAFDLPAYGERNAVSSLPVALLGEMQNTYTILLNAYFQELLGPRTSGAILNVGAGMASTQYRQSEMFTASAYHTLESTASGIACTYVCSATDMKPVAADSYDWVISTYVLEHIDDPFAAAREQMRVCKPGGFIYAAVPFAQIVHPHETFGDFWRFTPQGVQTLFYPFVLCEIEVWGANPTRPNGFSVLLQKPSPTLAPNTRPRFFWIEFDNEEPFELVKPSAQSEFAWPIWELRLNPMNLAMQLNAARDQYALQAGLVVDNATICKRYKQDYCARFGTLAANGARSSFKRVGAT